MNKQMGEVESFLFGFALVLLIIMICSPFILGYNQGKKREAILNLTSEKNLESSSFCFESVSGETFYSGYKLRDETEKKAIAGEWILKFKGDLILRGYKNEWYYYPSGNKYEHNAENLHTIWKRLEWERLDKLKEKND